MARIRNPRYAPEFLERRLSPSSFGVMPAPAEVSTISPTPVRATATQTPMRNTGEAPLPRDADGDPIPEPASDDEPGMIGPV